MQITADSTVADIATDTPASIKVFQQHGIDFCCGGKIPLAEACARRGLDLETLLANLQALEQTVEDPAAWRQAPLSTLIAHIQRRYHQPLQVELGRLSQMMAKVVSRHGNRLPETLLPLQATFERLQRELLEHMAKEDTVLFPSIAALEVQNEPERKESCWGWIEQPIQILETEHASAGAALATLRTLTQGYAPPEDACPTFRGLYYGLAELERQMHLHVHLENNILFPRAALMTREGR
jgi:regulator of cell morphogenesis and NO signaling